MSQIATLHVIPESFAAGLRAAAEPRKTGWFGRAKDRFWETLTATAPDVMNFEWSGYAVIMLFEFLREQGGFDLTRADEHPLAQFLSKARSSYFAVFEPDEARAFVEKLSATELKESELAAFANDFSGTNDADAGKSLLGAAESLRAALARVREGTLGLLHVG
jgi:hypothetical protein